MKRLLLVVTLVVSSFAQAQHFNTMTGQSFGNVYAANADFMMSQAIQRAAMQSMLARKRGAQPAAVAPTAAPAPVKKAAPLSATDFKPAGPRKVPEQLAADLPEADRAAAVKAFREILAVVQAEPSLRKNNLATSLAVMLGSAIEASSGRTMSDEEAKSFISEVNELLVADGGFKKAKPKDLTAASDTFLLTGALIAGLTEAGKEDPAQAKLAKELADALLGQFDRK